MNAESDDDSRSFSNRDEELGFWKTKAKLYKERLTETQQELEEFQTSSRELETELEAELEQSETRCKDLRHQLNRIALENDALKERLSEQSQTLAGRVDS